MTIFLSGIHKGKNEEQLPQPTVGRLSANSRPTVGWLLANCWPTVDQLSADCHLPPFTKIFCQQLADCWPFVGRLSSNCWQHVGNLLVNCRLTVGWGSCTSSADSSPVKVKNSSAKSLSADSLPTVNRQLTDSHICTFNYLCLFEFIFG